MADPSTLSGIQIANLVILGVGATLYVGMLAKDIYDDWKKAARDAVFDKVFEELNGCSVSDFVSGKARPHPVRWPPSHLFNEKDSALRPSPI